MKESYVEGLASYGGPESCVHIREDVGEALTGVRAGRVLSRVIHAPRRELRVVRGPRQWRLAEGHTGAAALARQRRTPRGHRPRARAETSRTGTGRSRVLLRPAGKRCRQSAS